jgi:tetratricopeptide (TPR) repeat protein
MDAWNNLQRGRAHLYRRTKDDLAEARTFLQRAIELDPGLGPAYSDLVEVYFLEVRLGIAEKPGEHLNAAMEVAKKAVQLDSEDAAAHFSVGRILSMKRRHQAAVPEFETAISLNPSYAQVYLGLGMALAFSGRPADALAPLEKAMRLSPHDEYMGPIMARMAEAYLFLRRHEDAVAWARKSARQLNLRWPGYASLASILGHVGELDEAKAALEEMARRMPGDNANLAFVREKLPIAEADDLDHLLEGLRLAGLPD